MRKPMKIAMMVRSFIPIPRPGDMIYAPIDIVMAIAKGLGARGHQVTIFAPMGTEFFAENVTIETMNLRPLVRSQAEFDTLINGSEQLAHGQPWLWDKYMINEIFKRADAGDFDLVHLHHPETALSCAASHPNIPVVYTLHDPIFGWYKELFELFASDNQKFLSISDNQRRDAPDLPYLATAYNGTDMSMFDFSENHDDYLLFVGRVNQEKGVKEAIQVAKESGHKLFIIGPTHKGSKDYFDSYIKPELNQDILYLGRMDQDQLSTYYQKAKALLTPVQWEEPFGLTTVEAMACGTPVISLRRGAAPEIIEDGKSGYIVDSVSEMVEAVSKIDKIKRKDCRKRVEDMFTHERMVDRYEEAFYSLMTDTEASKPKPEKPSKPVNLFLSKIDKVQKSIKKIIK